MANVVSGTRLNACSLGMSSESKTEQGPTLAGWVPCKVCPTHLPVAAEASSQFWEGDAPKAATVEFKAPDGTIETVTKVFEGEDSEYAPCGCRVDSVGKSCGEEYRLRPEIYPPQCTTGKSVSDSTVEEVDDKQEEVDEAKAALEACRLQKDSKLSALHHMMLSASYMRHWDIPSANSLLTQCIQFAMANDIFEMDFEEVGEKLLTRREKTLLKEINRRDEVRLKAEAYLEQIRLQREAHKVQPREPTIGELVDSKVPWDPNAALVIFPERQGCIPCSDDSVEQIVNEPTPMEFTCCGLFARDDRCCNAPSLEVHGNKMEVEVDCHDCCGQEEINKTSGEAKNPGPKVIVNAVKMAAGKGKGKKKNGIGKAVKSRLLHAAIAPKQAGFKGPLLPGQKRLPNKKGHGDYADDIGSSVGGWLGKKAVGLFKNVFGLGSYQTGPDVGSNAMVAGTSPPNISNDEKSRSFIFRHREYVAGVQSSNTFTNTNYNLNPGQYKLFPWLAPMASNFEEYKVLGMLAEYKSLVSPLATDASGQVIISTEYNPLKANFTSSTQALNAQYATSCKPYENMLHAIECDGKEVPVNVLQVRIGALPAGQDLRFYDLANIQVITEGQADTNTEIGQLWVTYEIAFFKPIYDSGLGLAVLSDKYLLSGVTSTYNLGTSITARGGSLLGTSISASANPGVITFPPNVSTGTYLLMFCYSSGSASTVSTPTLAYTKCSALTVWSTSSGGDLASYYQGPFASNTSGQQTLAIMVSIAAPGSNQASLSVSGLTVAGTTYCDLVITQVNGGIIS